MWLIDIWKYPESGIFPSQSSSTSGRTTFTLLTTTWQQLPIKDATLPAVVVDVEEKR
jgi:hypothetical protein